MSPPTPSVPAGGAATPGSPPSPARSEPPCPMPTVEEMEGFLGRLAGCEPTGADDATRVGLISTLEALKSAAAATQARLTAAFDASQRAEQAALGVAAADRGRGVASQVALARRDSPCKGRRHVGLAKALVQEMPHTMAALADGRLSEWRATVLVRETACLSAEHRAEVDRCLAGTPGRLDGLGDRGVERAARTLAQKLDPAAAVRRARRAVGERRVTLRPAPDTMSYLTALLPVAQGVAVVAALSRHADSLRAQGDARSRGQIMADTLVERATGQTRADGVPVEIHLVMTDGTLLASDDTPAHLQGWGSIPAGIARDLVHQAGGGEERTDSADEASARERARVWVRRLYTDARGRLVAMESQRRELDGLLRQFVVVRDQFCRTPWCDAPIRHGDHVERSADGGRTSAANTQGLCEACNYAKEAPGWSSRADETEASAPDITIRTPTGHRYTSRPPAPPGSKAVVSRGRRAPAPRRPAA